MLADAVAHYHDLLTDADAAAPRRLQRPAVGGVRGAAGAAAVRAEVPVAAAAGPAARAARPARQLRALARPSLRAAADRHPRLGRGADGQRVPRLRAVLPRP